MVIKPNRYEERINVVIGGRPGAFAPPATPLTGDDALYVSTHLLAVQGITRCLAVRADRVELLCLKGQSASRHTAMRLALAQELSRCISVSRFEPHISRRHGRTIGFSVETT